MKNSNVAGAQSTRKLSPLFFPDAISLLAASTKPTSKMMPDEASTMYHSRYGNDGHATKSERITDSKMPTAATALLLRTLQTIIHGKAAVPPRKLNVERILLPAALRSA